MCWGSVFPKIFRGVEGILEPEGPEVLLSDPSPLGQNERRVRSFSVSDKEVVPLPLFLSTEESRSPSPSPLRHL